MTRQLRRFHHSEQAYFITPMKQILVLSMLLICLSNLGCTSRPKKTILSITQNGQGDTPDLAWNRIERLLLVENAGQVDVELVGVEFKPLSDPRFYSGRSRIEQRQFEGIWNRLLSSGMPKNENETHTLSRLRVISGEFSGSIGTNDPVRDSTRPASEKRVFPDPLLQEWKRLLDEVRPTLAPMPVSELELIVRECATGWEGRSNDIWKTAVSVTGKTADCKFTNR